MVKLCFILLVSCSKNGKKNEQIKINDFDSTSFERLYEPYIPFFAFKIYNEKSINQYLIDQKAGVAKGEIIVSINNPKLEEYFFSNFKNHDKVTYLELQNFNSAFSIIELGKCQNLRDFTIRNSSIKKQDEVFHDISKLSKLETLVLFESLKDKQLDPSFCEIKQLKNLSIIDDSITILPLEFGQLINLKYLYLNCNLIKLPESIIKLQKLKQLNVAQNSLIEFPKPILKLENLVELDIEFNPINEIPDEIVKLKKLRKVGIFYTGIDEKLTEAFLLEKRMMHISDSSKIKFIRKSFFAMPH